MAIGEPERQSDDMRGIDIIPVMRPHLPTLHQLEPYLREIDTNRWYTNYGPLTRVFEERLACHFGVEQGRIVTASNGTIALVQIFRALDIRRGSLCVMPSWTFVATAAAADAAGLMPFFVDVELGTWSLSLDRVEALAEEREIGAVVPVAPFGAPFDMAAWSAFSRRTGIPVVLDAAAGFDTHRSGGPNPLKGLTTMVSLHATKVFGVGEGACIVAETAELGHAMRLHGNFGFDKARWSSLPGLNTKMSEYTAAVGLASFDAWDECRSRWATLTAGHGHLLAETGGLRSTPGFGGDWVSCYGLVELPDGLSVERAIEVFGADGIETRSWWGPGCHAQPAYAEHLAGDLRNTRDLADRVIGLPFWQGMDQEHFDRIARALSGLVRR